MPKKKKKAVAKKKLQKDYIVMTKKKRVRLPKEKPDCRKLTVDDFVPTSVSLVALRSMNEAQRIAIAECCDVIMYASHEEESKVASEKIKAFFLKYSKSKDNVFPDEKKKPKVKLPSYIPRFDHD